LMHNQARLQVAGIGSLLTIHPLLGELTTPQQLAAADQRLRRLLYLHLLDDGIYVAERGSMALSLALSEAEHDALLASVAGFVARYRALV
jgi:glutamate-1-semialdehyde 2,1-aminomutase